MDAESKVHFAKLFENYDEHPEPMESTVTGTIPKWLKGTMLKNAAGMFQIGPDQYTHFFDGLAFLQRFYIEDGKVWYSTRYLRSETYKTNMAAQRIVVSEFGTLGHPDPCKNIFSRYLSYFFPIQFTDNDLVNFIQAGDEVYATSETTLLNRVDPETLETKNQVSMKKYVTLNTATAHPHYDRDGNIYNMGTGLCCYKIVFVPKPDGSSKDGGFEKSRVIADIPMSTTNMSYYHSYGMSQNHVIFPEMPLCLIPWKLLTSAFIQKPFSDALKWFPKKDAVIHLVETKTGKKVPLVYKADPFFTFHHANAYEDHNCVFMDLVGYADGRVVEHFTLQELRNGHMNYTPEKGSGTLWRFVLPLSVPKGTLPNEDILAKMGVKTKAKAILQEDGSIRVSHEIIFNNVMEFPRINYDMCNGNKYRFCYGTGVPSASSHDLIGTCLYKIDVNDGSCKEWRRDNIYQFAGEPVFVASPGATDEDDGVILASVSDVKENTQNFLLFLDAKTFKEIARAKFNQLIPLGFHGVFLNPKQ